MNDDQSLKATCLELCGGDIERAKLAHAWVTGDIDRAIGESMAAYVSSRPAELPELRAAFATHLLDMNHSERAYILGRTVEAICECRASRGVLSKTDTSGASHG